MSPPHHGQAFMDLALFGCARLAQERPPVDLDVLEADGSMADQRLLAIVKQQQASSSVRRTAPADGNVEPTLHRSSCAVSGMD